MSNIKQNIDGHSKSILAPKPAKETQVNNCNCRKPTECPIPKNCLTESIVYQATVTTSDKRPPETYVGLTENKFKLRYANHKTSFRSILKQNCKELSKHIWDLKQRGIEYSIRWSSISKSIYLKDATYAYGRNFSLSVNRTWLCTLNRRNELVSTCRHASKLLLKNFRF